ncbi:ATP-binding protein [Falsiroseomonas tokyonensis]|uniref:ATP-binding protein n=1 Tax=Falsiroseomonas tokyonensis TaxID=430521 RepID=A0ABV7BUQ7_9PROT|nr:putative DNA binding domain-containing protein [Falsiroseomonas tokyonensis]
MTPFVVGERKVSLKELVQLLNSVDEHHNLEAKRGSQIGKSILETVCAFANEPRMGGGILLLGVEPEEGSLFPGYTVTGVADPDKITQDLVNQCNTVFNLPVRILTQTEQVNGETVIGVHVVEAPAAAKPIFVAKTGLPGGAFRRIGSSDVRCTEEDLAVLFNDRGVEQYDSTDIPGSSLADVDMDALSAYRRARAAVNPSAEELQLEDDDLLLALRCANPKPGGLVLTVAGLVLFGRSLALRRHMPMLRIDYARVPGKDWVEDAASRFEATLDMRGPLMTLLVRAQAAIMDDLPRAFHLPSNSLQREDEPKLPHRVIREALVNAAMHRSYREQHPVLIVRYANRLVIQNPGYSLKSEERLGEPGSVTRNVAIAAVLHDTNFAETKGTGIRAMQAEMVKAGLEPPQLKSDRVGNRFTATFLFHHFLTERDVNWLGQFREHNLTNEDHKALILVRETGTIDNRAYRDLNHTDPWVAGHALRRLRDAGLLKALGRTSGTFYVPDGMLATAMASPSDTTTQTDEDEDAGEGRLVDNTTGLADSSSGLADRRGALAGSAAALAGKGAALADSVHAAPTSLPAVTSPSGEKGSDLAPKTEPLRVTQVPKTRVPRTRRSTAEDLLSGQPELERGALPEELQAQLHGLGKRSDPDSMEAAVLALTAWRPLRIKDLARLMGRSVGYTGDIVGRMVAAKVLEPTIPSAPKHPEQTYRPRRETPTSK